MTLLKFLTAGWSRSIWLAWLALSSSHAGDQSFSLMGVAWRCKVFQGPVRGLFKKECDVGELNKLASYPRKEVAS